MGTCESWTLRRYVKRCSSPVLQYHQKNQTGPYESDISWPTKQNSFLFWGPTGTGKSRAAKSIYPDAFRKNGENKCWDTYTDQQNILVEEFRGQLPVSLLLKYLDRESLLVETKFLNSKKWIFTSNVPIYKWYPDMDADTIAAIERRFVVHHLTDLQGTQQWVESMGKVWITD